MSGSGLLVQLLTGLAEASSLFLVASGLSLIFGVTRIVNFAHGSMYMLGLYIAVSAAAHAPGGAAGYWASVAAAAIAVGILGALVEVILLRRVYRAPELHQLLATFALVLLFNDMALWIWGPEDRLGPRAPGLQGSVTILGRQFPVYNLVLMAAGPLVLAALWWALHRTRWGLRVRAATQDREMLAALGVNQATLFTAVFALGALLAGLGGAMQMPREPASLGLDVGVIGEAFVAVVVGGMGSIPGAFAAALLIAEVKALCVGLGVLHVAGLSLDLSRWTLVAEFAVMAVVLVLRPWGLSGRPQAPARQAVSALAERPLQPVSPIARVLAAVVIVTLLGLPLVADAFPYATVLATDMLIAVIFAASLHFIMGPAGMNSFGHAAYFGLGAYGAALLRTAAHLPMEAAFALGPFVAAAGALILGWFCVRLSGIYLAMLTLAFAQIVWSVIFQSDGVTGGSNGLIGVWPAGWLAAGSAYYYLTVAMTLATLFFLRRALFAPFGYAMRATRDSPSRAEAVGIDRARVQWIAFGLSGLLGGLAGSLYVFSKGGVAPDVLSMGKSVDALVMVLLGGVQAIAGPIAGATAFTWLQDSVMRATDYWRALLGAIILLLVLAFPQGIAGAAGQIARRWRRADGTQ